MNANPVEHVSVMIEIALRVLAQRSMTIIALLLNAGVVSWAMYSESWPRLAGALLFAVTSWCIINLTGADHGP